MVRNRGSRVEQLRAGGAHRHFVGGQQLAVAKVSGGYLAIVKLVMLYLAS